MNSPLPSRERAVELLHRVQAQTPLDAQDIRRIVSRFADGGLVDREANDYEAMLNVYDPEFASWRAGIADDDWERLRLELEAAAIGDTDERQV